jgi:PAS domain S-box-containing protein
VPINAISERANQFKKFVYRSITYPLILLTLFAAILSWRLVVLLEASLWVDRSDKVIAQANYTMLITVDEESGQRGYFVNNNPAFLQRYNEASQEAIPAFTTLENMVADSPEQSLQVKAMRAQFSRWQDQVNSELNASLAYPDSYRANFDQDNQKDLMGTLRSEFRQFITAENKIRQERADKTESGTWTTLILSALLAVLFSLGISIIWVKQTRLFANQYEEALKISARNVSLLSATLMSIGDAVLVTDTRGKVLQMNKVAEDLTGWMFADAYGMEADTVFKTVDRTTRSILESPIRRVTAEGKAIGLSDQAILIRRDGSELAIDDSCSPILDDVGRLAGAILVFRDVTERKRAESELSRLYEREHRISENLQRSLLTKPDPKLFPELEIHTIYQPAWAEAKVGGDYFDIIGLAGNRAGLIVGDVSGKGLKAASRTAEMKFTFRAYLRETADVADSVCRLNQFVCRSQSFSADPSSFFLCLTAIVIDPVSGRANICVCGVEPPLLIRADGTIEEILASGAPIGVFEDSAYLATEIVLQKGDLIVVTTDGITEARHGGDFLGNDGLAKLASDVRSMRSLADAGTKIIRNVKEFANNELSDDVCLMLIRRK